MITATPSTIIWEKSDRALFLTKDLKLIEEQLYHGLTLLMSDIKEKDLLDDINTDVMTPAWVCFHHDPKEIAKRAYAGLLRDGKRVFHDHALIKGNFRAIVSGERKGTGSSRETAAQCERYSGVRMIFASSFAPIHRRNNINLGQIMGNLSLFRRLQDGEEISIEEMLSPFDEFSQGIIKAGGLFPFLKRYQMQAPKLVLGDAFLRPLTMAQKILADKLIGNDLNSLLDHKTTICRVDAGYSHEFTTAQVDQFLKEEFGNDYQIKNSDKFAAFEDHLIYATEVTRFAPFIPLIEDLRRQQKNFIKKTGVKDYSAKSGISPGICHEVAREDMILPGEFIQATDSHTCMGGALNAFACGIGSTEYAALLATGLAVVEAPPSIRFDFIGKLRANCTAKDVMLFILANYTKRGLTLNKVMEFGGVGLSSLSMDERATICNMATECGAKTGICEPDDLLIAWLLQNRRGLSREKLLSLIKTPDRDCAYEARYTIDLSIIRPMVAHPGDPDRGIPSDPTNGLPIHELGDIAIDIAYGGSCTAGKFDDIDMYAKVTQWALARGYLVKKGVRFYLQYGSKKVADYAHARGLIEDFKKAGVILIEPGCGACIGCGPGVSDHKDQVTVSAINRNFQGRSGPGKLYLASPLSVAASAFFGKIVAFDPTL
ncbi:MAG TPA: aconitase family protein [Myxococcota bacterium]|nr:aconitase family protein [Myxococcota bacterium]